MADNFNIAKFLKENSLGSFGILGKYVDLHALKEQDETGGGGLFSITLDTATDLNDIESYADENGISINVVNPSGPGGGWPEVEYTGSKEALEGLIDTFFSEDADYTKSKIMPAQGSGNPWMNDSMPQERIGNWIVTLDFQMGSLYLENPGIEGLTVYATPGWEGTNGIALEIVVDGDSVSNEPQIVPGSKGSYETFEDYAAAMEPILADLEKQYGGKMQEAEDLNGIETSDLKKGDTVEYEGNEYIIGDFDTAGGANLVYLNPMDGKPAEDSKDRYKKVHKSRVKKLNKEADYGNNQYDGKYDDQFGPATVNEDEMDSHNRMLGLIDTNIEDKLPALRSAVKSARDKGLSDMSIFKMLSTNSMTKSSVDSLIADGFAPEDVVDFFATDFTSSDDLEYDDAESFDYGDRPGPNDPMGPNEVEEEVSVSSSGVEMEGISEDIDIWQMAGDHLDAFRNKLASTLAMASESARSEEDPDSIKRAREWVSALNKIALKLDALEGAMAEANAKLGVLPTK